ncbi:single-stranded DNA-binding protein [Cohnella nanjingensis]|uniref:Single-stranded DNA-binding protein n=1 Tax=Cohnella nanjingensis TaxID=1387779 RepID=A0A7X0RSC1_9BACL|nr:single-stranded DNA-binding protein [Cohnella nanjingensis]MBB6672598.1 single-stranded DNA-binding protein [Cohnella nanjingensis]
MNRIVLIGRAAKDWELRYTGTGTGIANGVIAVDRQVSQGKEKEADFINLVAFKQTAETCANYIKKGHRFAVEGRLQVRSYDNNEGRKVWVSEVLVDRIEFLEPKQQGSQNQTEGRHSTPPPIDDDDLPF